MSEPAWAIATLFPGQGDWSDEDYLSFSTERPLVELSHRSIEVLPLPTDGHQRVLDALFLLLAAHARSTGGRVRTAGIRVRLGPGAFRQPDIVYVGPEHLGLRGEDFWTGADLVVEVVSGGSSDRMRDCVTKRREYAEAGIPEYWIVDPAYDCITVLRLEGDAYVEHGAFERGTVVTSPMLADLGISVSEILDAD